MLRTNLKSSISLGLCFFCACLCHGQETIFKGLVKNQVDKGVNDCYILIINKDNNKIISYTVPNPMGYYNIVINLNAEAPTLEIKCQGMGYETTSTITKVEKTKEIYTIDFVLNEKIQDLDEIILKGTKKIQIKNDTTVYNVSNFKREADRKIIDVLKNMPGIQVNSKTGHIKFKGKPIETLLLDGDDLFGKSYSIGAKNISVDIVSKVEAIEDYHENKLEKGITKSNKVALNLKFKSGKIDFSGEAAVGLGYKSYLVNLNNISITETFKSFSTINLNNISLNNTSFSPENYHFENAGEIKNYGIDFFRESSITGNRILPRSYDNELKFISLNNLIDVSKKIKFKSNISLFKDRVGSWFSTFNKIKIGENEFLTSNETTNFAKPQKMVFNHEFYIRYFSKIYIEV